MIKETKHARILRALKRLVLASGNGISRLEAAEYLDIDQRTAALYLEQLTEEGLLKCERFSGAGRGRPRKIYRSNTNNLYFIGVQIQSDLQMSVVAVDSAGRELQRNSVTLPDNVSRLSVFQKILQMVKRCQLADGRLLYGIGLAISRWLQPPLVGEDVYANLAEYLERECKVAVCRDVNINAVAWALAEKINCRDLALIHTGNVIEFGLVRNGVPEDDFRKRETWLSHLCVNADGRRCYCGKYGCLENYVTNGSKLERINSSDNSKVILRTIGKMLGVAMERLVHKYPVKTVVLIGAEDIFPAAEDYFLQHVPHGVKLLCTRIIPAVDYAAALEASHLLLHSFIESTTK